MDDFSWTNKYHDVQEEKQYFWSCNSCFWEDEDTESNVNDLKICEECPKCGCNVYIESDMVQK